MTTTAERMLQSLSDLGVHHIFGIVGREADSIMFDECEDIEFVLTRHEADAGFMAVAMSRYTGTHRCVSPLSAQGRQTSLRPWRRRCSTATH